jgi:hypothetical protein
MAKWSMFLDSTRVPPYGFVVARDVAGAKRKCLCRGVPENLVLEFYLGLNQQTGLEFVKWLIQVDHDMNGEFIPRHFTFYVHSQNEEGKIAIEDTLNEYLIERRQQFITPDGHVERRDQRRKPYFLEERRKHHQVYPREKSRIVWGNLSGSDFAMHTRYKLFENRRKH